jgi:hypothetical protein
MKIVRALFVVVLSAVWLTACSSEVVPSSGPHAPTAPYQVLMYGKPPRKYEIIGNLSLPITPELRWDDRGDANAAFTQLIQQAAALGANGIYFDPNIPGATVTAIAGYHGVFYTVPVHADPTTPTRTVLATAIWVIDQ